MKDVFEHNRRAWNLLAESGSCQWSIPVSTECIREAREGNWAIILTPIRPVPAHWFPPLEGLNVLGLAASGGQQMPTLAAAGAKVTALDASPSQLALDRQVAERESLQIEIVCGDMADLSQFQDASFDLIVNPCSVCFVEDVLPVWRECYRVLRSGGRLMTGFLNPTVFLFDEEEEKRTGELTVRYSLPYSDSEVLSRDALEAHLESGKALTFSHTLSDIIGGQLRAGLRVIDMYEDEWRDEATLLNRYMKTSIATLAEKP